MKTYEVVVSGLGQKTFRTAPMVWWDASFWQGYYILKGYEARVEVAGTTEYLEGAHGNMDNG